MAIFVEQNIEKFGSWVLVECIWGSFNVLVFNVILETFGAIEITLMIRHLLGRTRRLMLCQICFCFCFCSATRQSPTILHLTVTDIWKRTFLGSCTLSLVFSVECAFSLDFTGICETNCFLSLHSENSYTTLVISHEWYL